MPDTKEKHGMPGWAQAIGYIGIPGFIAVAMLGFVPGLRSPIDRLEAAQKSAATEMAEQQAATRLEQRATLALLRAICYRLPENPSAPPCYTRGD
jgi:hypothetical protein